MMTYIPTPHPFVKAPLGVAFYYDVVALRPLFLHHRRTYEDIRNRQTHGVPFRYDTVETSRFDCTFFEDSDDAFMAINTYIDRYSEQGTDRPHLLSRFIVFGFHNLGGPVSIFEFEHDWRPFHPRPIG